VSQTIAAVLGPGGSEPEALGVQVADGNGRPSCASLARSSIWARRRWKYPAAAVSLMVAGMSVGRSVVARRRVVGANVPGVAKHSAPAIWHSAGDTAREPGDSPTDEA
jgi:hypothetical protein